ncbi:MAG: HAMP domain-containing histidine kinase [Elusimicrobia bacterium]|nr:HAMP domain-containing histidine kinase [Elusimicrobiota bacterium]
MRIRTKITLWVMALMTAVVAAVTTNALYLERGRVVAESQARFDALLEGVLRIARESLAARDELMLLGYLKVLLADYPEIETIVVSRAGHSSILGQATSELILRRFSVTAPSVATFKPVEAGVPATAAAPAPAAGKTDTLGIEVGFSKAALQRQIRQAQTALIRRVGGVAAVGLALGMLGSWWLGFVLARPVGELAAASRRLGDGQLDATVAVRGRDEFAELARQFNAMAAKLRDSIRFKEDLMSTLTHELNNPLSGLKGFLSFLHDAGPEQRAEAVRTMEQAVQQMEVSLRSALDLFRTGAQPKLKHERFDLRSIVEEVIRLFEPSALSRKQELSFASAGPALVEADRELMRRIVINLVSNGLKYTPAGGRVDVRLERAADGTTHLAVADTGPGVAPEDREKIFTKFYRAPGPGGRAQRIPGSGLGLAIAKQAVDLHGGRIWVESVVGKRSVFHVSLPRSGGTHVVHAK